MFDLKRLTLINFSINKVVRQIKLAKAEIYAAAAVPDGKSVVVYNGIGDPIQWFDAGSGKSTAIVRIREFEGQTLECVKRRTPTDSRTTASVSC